MLENWVIYSLPACLSLLIIPVDANCNDLWLQAECKPHTEKAKWKLQNRYFKLEWKKIDWKVEIVKGKRDFVCDQCHT